MWVTPTWLDQDCWTPTPAGQGCACLFTQCLSHTLRCAESVSSCPPLPLLPLPPPPRPCCPSPRPCCLCVLTVRTLTTV
jgi:hypothetical protein